MYQKRPASLGRDAYFLRKLGYNVTVFEAKPERTSWKDTLGMVTSLALFYLMQFGVWFAGVCVFLEKK